MSVVCVLTPIVISSWPAISAAITGAAAALGMAVVKEGQEAVSAASASSSHTVEVALEKSEVLSEEMATDEQIVLTKGDVRVRVFRDARGQCRLSASGVGRSHAELRQIGNEVAGRITQLFVYNKVLGELRTKGFEVVGDELAEDQSVHVHVRRMVD